MIGISCSDSSRSAVEEFFQLFKVPWEFYRKGGTYRILMTSGPGEVPLDADLVVIFGFRETGFDRANGIGLSESSRGIITGPEGMPLPIYAGASRLKSTAPDLPARLSADGYVLSVQKGRSRFIRVGFDPFLECQHLLSAGQPPENAGYPALDTHIANMREWILGAGCGLAEILSKPGGFDCTVCLTHDVDFLGIRHHLGDRSLLGFLVRALFPFWSGHSAGRGTARLYLRNLGAVFSLPFVLLGVARDPWYRLDRYAEMESGLNSTFFFIPFKDRPGTQRPSNVGGSAPPAWRSARYDLSGYGKELSRLAGSGHEIALHGLDAWHDTEKGKNERTRIAQVSSSEAQGVRMHWLYFDEGSPAVLEKAGFTYDSTLGYNETVGFRNGTAQVFQLPGAAGVLELPLLIQDSAMFYRKRMALTEGEAFALCRTLLEECLHSAGVMTINWHQRSIAPERNWDGFYQNLLSAIRSHNVWFATCSQAVAWYRHRRSVRFSRTGNGGTRIRVDVKEPDRRDLPHLVLRNYEPEKPAAPWPERRAGASLTDTPVYGSATVELP